MNLEQIKKQYPDEWVLIEFTDVDQSLRVVEGNVIAHSASRAEIEKLLLQAKNSQIAVEYTGEGDSGEAYLL